MRCSHMLWVLVAMSLSAAAVMGAEPVQRATALIPKAHHAAKADGILAGTERKQSLVLSGFHALPSAMLEQRTGATYLAWSDEFLHIGIVTEMPPDGELQQRNKPGVRDFANIGDDSVEVWLDPHRAARDAGEIEKPFFWLIVNPSGDVSDARLGGGSPRPDLTWDAKARIVSRPGRAGHVWRLEIAVPWQSMGLEKAPEAGSELGLIVSRNWKRPGVQATITPYKRSFVNVGQWPSFIVDAGSPRADIPALGGRIFEGMPALEVRVSNPSQAPVDFDIEARIKSSDTPERSWRKSVKVPPAAQKSEVWDIRGQGTLNAEADHWMSVTVRAGGRPVLSQSYRWTKPKEPAWKVGKDLPPALQVAYLPSYNKAQVKLSPISLGGEIKAGDVTLRLISPNGAEVCRRRMKPQSLKEPSEWVIDLPPLPDGEFRLVADVPGVDTSPEGPIRRKHFPFEGSKLGVTEEVYPPFKLIEVEGRTVRVVLRELETDGLGLWSSIKAADKEVLAGPMRLVLPDGTAIEGRGAFTKTADAAVDYEGRAEAPGVAIATRNTTEFDGCMKVRLTLTPKGDKPLPGLALEIPLREDVASLWHPCTSSVRVNPAGRIPTGRGRFWDSTVFSDKRFFGYFLPYIWLGQADRGRGLCWFAENDKGWELATYENGEPSAPALELHRRDGAVVLRVNLVQKPVKLREPRTITFGLMASPAKPMRPDWRRVLFVNNPNWRDPDVYAPIVWIGAQYWGSNSAYYDRYPRNGDLSILDKTLEARRTRKIDHKFLDKWMARNFDESIPEKTRKVYRKLALVTMARGGQAQGNSMMNAYWEVFWGTSASHPEARYFRHEWGGVKYDNRDLDYPMYRGNVENVSSGKLVPSYLDFATYWAAEFIRRGIGIYFDNTYLAGSDDPFSSDAYRLPDGRTQPGTNIWRQREYFKRIWTLHQQLTPPDADTIMMMHMTNTHIVPTMVFNESNLDLEWHYDARPQQAKYPWDMLLVQSTGLLTGNVPLALAEIRDAKTEEQAEVARRTRFGVMATHEIRVRPHHKGIAEKLWGLLYDFGYGLDDCTVYNYWAPDTPLRIDDEDCKYLALRRGGKTMIILCTWQGKPSRIELTTTLPGKRLVDAETGKPLADLADGKAALTMDVYGVRVLYIE